MEATSISTTGSRGATLLELMAVMAIMMLLTGAAAVAVRPALEDARLRSGLSMVIADLRYARGYAIAYHTETALLIEVQEPALSVQAQTTDSKGGQSWETVKTPAGRRQLLPQGIKVMPLTAAPALATDQFSVSFSPLGRTTSMELRITDGHGGEHDYTVDGITGRCAPAEEAQ